MIEENTKFDNLNPANRADENSFELNPDKDFFDDFDFELYDDSLDPSPTIICLTKRMNIVDGFFVFEGHCFTKLVRSTEEMSLDDITAHLIEDGASAKVHFRHEGKPFLKGWKRNYFTIKLPFENALKNPGRKRLTLMYKNEYVGRVLYRASDYRRGHKRRTKPIEVEERFISLVQSRKNTVYVAVSDVRLPSPTIMCLTRKTRVENNDFVIEGHCLTKFVRGKEELDLSLLSAWFQNDEFTTKIDFRDEIGKDFIRGWKRNYFVLRLPMDLLFDKLGRRRLSILYKGEHIGRFMYSAFNRNRGFGRKSKVIYVGDHGLQLRQNKMNTLYVLSSNADIPIIVNITKKVSRENNDIVVRARCLTKLLYNNSGPIDTDLIRIEYGENNQIDPAFKYKCGIPFIKGYRLNSYQFSIPLDSIAELDIQNRLIVKYKGDANGRIMYSAKDYTTGHNRNTEVFTENGLSVYFRQTVKNTMYLTVREENFFDTKEGQDLANKAYKIAKKLGPSEYILMFEKESEKYEESASVLYEKLIDIGYKNVYYVLNKDNKAIDNMPEKYKANLLEKHSLEHIVMFFRCRKFIGTETIGHAIQLRAANKRIVDKVNSKDISYVFLQHGVMYMISLDADLRSGFKQSGLNLYRVVTSSQAEADHFLELGGFREEELYVTGLAKFDRSYRYDDADKIVIMPTWRRWEANEARDNFVETAYYKMIDRIVSVIPKQYEDKIVILPHPLMQKAMESNEIPLGKYVHPEKTHDETLRECRLLITDYSSIAYDAFYRGSNTIFYWEEKEECLEHYGGAHLMINEDNVFGDVCYNKEELSKVIEKNYIEEQSAENTEKYRYIVEFHDNRNSERIVKKLIEDKILQYRKKGKKQR